MHGSFRRVKRKSTRLIFAWPTGDVTYILADKSMGLSVVCSYNSKITSHKCKILMLIRRGHTMIRLIF